MSGRSWNAIVELHNLEKSYFLGKTRVHALRGISLTLYSGEFTALVGSSGSGKSTLLNLVGCLDEPDSGRVILDGQDVNKLSDKEKSNFRNRKIGFIFQSFNLVPTLDVYENVELPLLINREITLPERKERVTSALADVGIGSLARNLPDQLSGGQRQRVAIARSLACHPTLVLADEPTANLDSTTSHKIIDLMLDLNRRRNVTFLFSTHDEKLMSRVSRILRIQDGLLVGDSAG